MGMFGNVGRRRRPALLLLAIPGVVFVGTERTGAESPPTPASPPRAASIPLVAGQGLDDSYVVIMEADPVVAYSGGEPGLAPTSPSLGESVDPTDPAVIEYVDFLQDDQRAALAEAGIAANASSQSYTFALSGFEAALTERQAAALEHSPRVAKVVPNALRPLATDNTPDFLGLTAPGGAWAAGYTGEDVVVGVIDTGIWPEHPSFADDGSYTRLPGRGSLQCNFGDTEYNPDDVEFRCNNKLMGAYDMRRAYKRFIGPETYNSARDSDGHGTHTASTAAGNADVPAEIFGIDRGTVSGIAHRARIIAYSACGEQGCFSSDLVKAIDKAVENGVDVINYSIGGGASLTGPEDLAFLNAATEGHVWVAVSNGNDGPGPETGGGPASVPWVTAVGASTQNRTFSAQARLENGPTLTGASITRGTGRARRLVDAEDLDNEICDPDEGFDGNVNNRIVLCLRGVVDRVAKSEAVADAGGAGMILYNPNDAQALVTDLHFVPTVHINFTDGQTVKEYIDDAGSDARATLTQGVRVGAEGSVMADFSSRGPSTVAPDLIKPDVTAPGVNILAGHTPTPTAGAPGQLFQSISGTSMSSPHTAGLYALMRQAHPKWSAAIAKSALMTSARLNVTKEDASTPADPFDMGAGHVRPGGPPSAPGSMFNPGVVYNANILDYLGFLCDADSSVFSDPEGTCAFLESEGEATEAHNLNLPSIGVAAVTGEITIQRRIRSVAPDARSFTSHVQAPPGFAVTVSPRGVRLEPGESRLIDITITNVSAPVDEWRFGRLTWTTQNGYRARSPIAVKASLFLAPDSVQGTGTAGSVSFPVTFGYTGPYDANAHGPVPATVANGTVGQDEDQTFDPDDPEGTTAVPIVVNDTAHLRIALDAADLTPPDPDIDLDLYLYDEGGDEVAFSAAGGTAEQIDVQLPEDGTYTLYVHGWQTGGTTVGFALRSWQVPLAAGTGALTIDSAPAAAVSGTTATIEASWTGLTADRMYLGAVSHNRGAELLGLTLVEIDT